MNKNIKIAVNRIFNYIAALALAVIFALYLSGRVGWFLVAAFISAPIISVLLTLLFVTRIHVRCSLSAAALCKNEKCELDVSVINNCFLPTPPVILTLCDSPLIRCRNKVYSVSVMPLSSEHFSAEYKANICGPSDIGISQITVSDYFGIFSFALKNTIGSELVHTAAVIPDISAVSQDNDTVRQAAAASAMADDSEETVEGNIFFGSGGFPGYENREYYPGDPLKRINWKLSAKKGKLLVRLDDEFSCSAITIVLDSCLIKESVFMPSLLQSEQLFGYRDDEIIPALSQIAVEDSLGFARTMLMSNYSVNYLLKGNGGWESYPISDEQDISVLRTALASYRFSEASQSVRFPVDELMQQKGTVSVFCTPYLDEALWSEISGYANGVDGKTGLRTTVFAAAAAPDINVNEKGAEG